MCQTAKGCQLTAALTSRPVVDDVLTTPTHTAIGAGGQLLKLAQGEREAAMAAGLGLLVTHDTNDGLFDVIVRQCHTAVFHNLLLAADVNPDGAEAVVLEEKLIEGTVGEDEVVVVAPLCDGGNVDVGCLAEEVLRLSHAMHGLVQQLATVAGVDEQRPSGMVAEGLQHVATEVGQRQYVVPFGGVVDAEALGRGAVYKFAKGEVLGELHAQIDGSFHVFLSFYLVIL